ncbi:glycosyltransferase family 39 protein [Candidatus Binatia bacterium]|nr:glycosyltransferase family 39 protein [Candidatus Binatia bacterium]
MPVARNASHPATAAPTRGLADDLLLLALGTLLLLLGLGSYPLWDPGEGRSALVTREMADAGRWLVPLLYGDPYYHKPAPFFALLRAFQAAFGVNELALRLPSALATIATAVLLRRFARARAGRRTALAAGVIYLTSPEVVALGRFCNFDATLSLCVTWATTAWLSWLDDRRATPWSAWAAIGCGVLVKGPVALVLPILVAASSAWRRGVVREAARAARPLRGMLLVSLLVLPWLGPALIADPDYVRTFLVRHNFERYASSGFAHVRGPLYFVPALFAGFFPWSLLLPAAARAVRWRGPSADAAIWAGAVIGFFSLGQAKLATYVLPAFPALSLWLAIALADAQASAEPRVVRLLRAAALPWTAILVALPFAAAAYAWFTYPELLRAALAAWALPIVGWLAYRRLAGARFAVSAVALAFAAANVVALTSFYLRAAPFVSRTTSDAALAAAARATGLPVIAYRIQPASFAWYFGTPIQRTSDAQSIARAARTGTVLVVTRERYAGGLRSAGITPRTWLDTRRHLLYATGPVP